MLQDQSTALHYVSYQGNVEAVVFLLHAGADVDATKVISHLSSRRTHRIQRGFGSTPLRFACAEGHTDVVWQLLLAGADITVKHVSTVE